MHDSDGFQPLELEQHRSFLRRLARELVGGEAAAEDLVQDAFVRALERPPASSAALRSWLRGVVHHLAINRARGARRVAAREQRAARCESTPPPEEALASLELQERLIAAVKALDEPYRTTVWLRFHEGLAPEAIAGRLGTGKKTIESRLTRGLALLRKELDRQSGGDRERWLGALLVLARDPGLPWITSISGVGIMKKVALAVVVAGMLGVAWRLAPRPDSDSRGEFAAPAAAIVEATTAAVLTEAQRSALVPEEPPTSANGARSELLVHVRWSDGTPAPNVGLILYLEDDPRGARAVLRLRSNSAGLVQVAAVAPGRVRIEADRGGERTLRMAAQGRTEVVFELAAGLDVEGTVTDAAGAPLPGAEILLVSDALDWLATRVVTHAAANGAYRVRAVQPEFSVSARAGDFAPALLQPLSGRAGSVHIDFVLGAEGAGLRGLVRDPTGRPVAGALVAVGDPSGYYEDDSEHPGAYLMARGLRVEETDEQGRFFAAGARIGFGLSVAVQAEDYPIAVANVSAGNGATAFVETALVAPAVLTGVVRSPAGAPVSGVKLTTILSDGTGAKDIPFRLPAGVSDASGRFRLELLPHSCALLVDPPPGIASGHSLVRLELAPGETMRDLVLAADDAVRGRVEAPVGTKFDGWFVRAYEQLGGGRIRRAEVDPEGRFELAGCAQPPYRVELYAAPDRPVLRVDDVGPGPELVLVAAALGSIQGEFIDAAGLLPVGVLPEIRLTLREFVTHAPTWSEKGRFAFELLRPGRYWLTFVQAERPLFATWVELGPGEHVDLGRIASAPLGSLVLAFDPYPSAGIRGTVLDDGLGAVATLELVDGRLGVPVLPPGEWRLDLEAEGTARISAPFSIRPGERTELRLATTPGVERSLAFRLDEGAWNTLHVELRDARGGRVFARRIQSRYWPRAGAGPSFLVCLPVGTFTLEAETDSGLSLRTQFDVSALAPQDAALEFELR